MIATLCLLWMAGAAYATMDTKSLTVNATVGARASMTLSTNTINFPGGDPDTTPSIPANENPVTVTVKVRTGSSSTVTLTHQASENLKDGAKSISITKLSWTAIGAGFVAGTMSKNSEVMAGNWTGPGICTGTFSYFFDNNWEYEPGNYSTLTTYTLTAP